VLVMGKWGQFNNTKPARVVAGPELLWVGGDDDPNSPGYCLAYHGRPIADCAGTYIGTLIGQSVTCWAQTVETAGMGGTGGCPHFQGIALRAHLFLGAFQSPSSCARLANSRTSRSKSSLHVECQLPHCSIR